MESKKYFSIKIAASHSGLSEFVIRSWEKRYKILNPLRTPSNRRLYSSDEITKLKLLAKAVKTGHRIGNICSLSKLELNGLNLLNENIPTKGFDDYNSFKEKALKAINNLDEKEFESLLTNLTINYNIIIVLKTFLAPFINSIGALWEEGSLRISAEHLASEVISKFLINLKNSRNINNNALKVLFATPVGQIHELGVLIAATIAAERGFNSIYLGPNLPAVEIIHSAIKLNAKAVCLSIVYPANDVFLSSDLANFEMLPDNIQLLVGGKSASSYENIFNLLKNANVVFGLDDFSAWIEKLK